MTDYVMVPREPTPEMLRNAHNVIPSTGYRNGLLPEMWSAMIEAAPQQSFGPAGTFADKRGTFAEFAQQQAEPAQMPIARITVRGNSAELVNLYAPGLPDGEHDLFCAPCSPDGQWAPSMFAEQQAEPVADSVKMQAMSALNLMQSIGMMEDGRHPRAVLRTFIQLAAMPRITTAQVEQIKRLADEVESSAVACTQAEYSPMGDPSLKYKRQQLDEDRAALHAALDALVKGE